MTYVPPPPPPQRPEQWRHGLSLLQRLAVFVAAVGFIVGIALSLVPLPAPSIGGTCGPGSSSDSAIVLRLHPNDPLSGVAVVTPYQQAFADLCAGMANDRLTLSGVIALASLVVGAAGVWVFKPR